MNKTKKKQKYKGINNYWPPLHKQTPNFPRKIIVYRDNEKIASILIKGYITAITSPFQNISFEIIDTNNQFDAKGKKLYLYSPKPIVKRFEGEKIIHVFFDHDCGFELCIRGLVQELRSKKTIISFHVSNEDIHHG